MHKILIENLGPISKCEMNISDLMILTGAQSTGKSTIAKAIYFFRSIKDDIIELILEQISNKRIERISNLLSKRLRSKFLQLFGTSHNMNGLVMEYCYNEDVYVKLSLEKVEIDMQTVSTKYVWIDLSPKIIDCLNEITKDINQEYSKLNNDSEISHFNMISNSDLTIKMVKNYLNILFSDNCETVFVPAGRSLITLLGGQLDFIFYTMNEKQRQNIDYCTQTYIRRIMMLKDIFKKNISELIEERRNISNEFINFNLVKKAQDVIESILKGNYVNINNEERLIMPNGKFIKINYTSSGQQESLWILYLIFYYILNNNKIFLILEEPESHLYPNSQKLITELVGLFFNNGENKTIITTHSPYILGAFNNLLYASKLGDKANVIDKRMRVEFDKTSAYFVENGEVKDCKDYDMLLIKNEVIDKASSDINKEFDDMFNIEYKMKSKTEE